MKIWLKYSIFHNLCARVGACFSFWVSKTVADQICVPAMGIRLVDTKFRPRVPLFLLVHMSLPTQSLLYRFVSKHHIHIHAMWRLQTGSYKPLAVARGCPKSGKTHEQCASPRRQEAFAGILCRDIIWATARRWFCLGKKWYLGVSGRVCLYAACYDFMLMFNVCSLLLMIFVWVFGSGLRGQLSLSMFGLDEGNNCWGW